MNQARIEWLHRLGIDVWRLRETQEPKRVSASRQSETTTRQNKESVTKVDTKTDQSGSPPPETTPTESKLTETVGNESIESEAQPIDSTRDSADAEQPSFQLLCVSVGTCLVVFDAGDQYSNEMALGVGLALSKYEATSHQSMTFVWPPSAALNLPSELRHGGWESARRAFHSLIGRQDWTTDILVTVGSDANEVTERLRNSEYTVLKLDEFPTSTKSKRELWKRIQEIS